MAAEFWPLVQPAPLQPSFSMPWGSVEMLPADRARHDRAALIGDQVLEPPDIALGHVEVVVARVVRDEVLRVDRAAEELEGVVEAVERLEVFDSWVPLPTAAKVKVLSSASVAVAYPANSTRT